MWLQTTAVINRVNQTVALQALKNEIITGYWLLVLTAAVTYVFNKRKINFVQL